VLHSDTQSSVHALAFVSTLTTACCAVGLTTATRRWHSDVYTREARRYGVARKAVG
jgi:hypothetical protein